MADWLFLLQFTPPPDMYRSLRRIITSRDEAARHREVTLGTSVRLTILSSPSTVTSSMRLKRCRPSASRIVAVLFIERLIHIADRRSTSLGPQWDSRAADTSGFRFPAWPSDPSRRWFRGLDLNRDLWVIVVLSRVGKPSDLARISKNDQQLSVPHGSPSYHSSRDVSGWYWSNGMHMTFGFYPSPAAGVTRTAFEVRRVGDRGEPSRTLRPSPIALVVAKTAALASDQSDF